MRTLKRLRWLFLAIAVAASTGLAYVSAYTTLEQCTTTAREKCQRQRAPEWQAPLALLLVLSGTGFVLSWFDNKKQ